MSNIDRKFRRQGIQQMRVPLVEGLPEGVAPGVLMGVAVVNEKTWEVIIHPSTKEWSIRGTEDGVLTFSEQEVAGIAFNFGLKIDDPKNPPELPDEMVDVVVKGVLYRLTRQIFVETVIAMVAKAKEEDVTESPTPPVTGEAASIIPPIEGAPS